MKECNLLDFIVPDWQLDSIKFAERRAKYDAAQKEYKEQEAIKKIQRAPYERFVVQVGSEQAESLLNEYTKFSHCNSNTLIFDTGCSVRLKNLLKSNRETLGININDKTKLVDLNLLCISDFIKCKGSGAISSRELMTLCFYAKVDLI